MLSVRKHIRTISYSRFFIHLFRCGCRSLLLSFFLPSQPRNGSECLARAWRMSLPHTANRTPP